MAKTASLIVLALALSIGLLALHVQRAGKFPGDDRLTVWVFDVGQGDSIFIDAPEKQVLIDGGPSSRVVEKLGRVMLPWDRSIDVAITTHPHKDHAFGIAAVDEQYAIGELVTAAGQGTSWDLGDGATLEVVWPLTPVDDGDDEVHEENIVTLLTYGDMTMLLTGDAEQEQEEGMLVSPSLRGTTGGVPAVDILKVGHHGSDTSTGNLFLNIVRPEYALVSVGADNSYGHPSPFVLERLRQAGAEVLRTDINGDIRVTSDGGEPRVSLWRL